MAEEEKFFLACLRHFLKGKADTSEGILSYLGKGIDWPLVLSWSQWHGVTPVIYHILKEIDWTGVPEMIRKGLERSFRINMARNLFLSAEIDRVFAALGERGIISIPIKGIFLSEEVYPDISFRMITDIDILIRKDDLRRAEEILTQMGYERDQPLKDAFFPDNCYTLHMEKGEKNGQKLCVELHWGLANRRDYTLPVESWWEREIFRVAQNRHLKGGMHCLTMGPEITLLYLTINAHMSRYAFLKQLVDIGQVIRYYENDIHWERVTRIASELGLLDNFIFALSLVHSMFDVPIAKELAYQSASWKHRVFQSLFTEQRLVRGKMGQDLRQLLLLFLLNEKAIVKSACKVIFSSRETIAYRYGLSPQSYRTNLYVLLNPLFALYRLLRGCVVDCWAGKGIGEG
ncbi:MAG: nucleotidyltransferase family protein [bacterium]